VEFRGNTIEWKKKENVSIVTLQVTCKQYLQKKGEVFYLFSLFLSFLIILHLAEIFQLQHFNVSTLIQLDDALLAVDGQKDTCGLSIFAHDYFHFIIPLRLHLGYKLENEFSVLLKGKKAFL